MKMTEQLESIVNVTQKPTLKQELAQAIHDYPKSWKNYVKGLK